MVPGPPDRPRRVTKGVLTTMFQDVTPAPPDAILGLSEAFKADPRPGKINLAVGVYKDANAKTPVLDAVKAAERRLVDTETTKGYLPIDGSPAYAVRVQAMLFGDGHPTVENGRAGTAHTPGGTGGLRVAGDYLQQNHPGATLWLSDPTWANHQPIFAAAGLATKTYPYLDRQRNTLDFDAMLAALRDIPAGDVVLLHGCCHNPTGVDPTPDQWRDIAAVLAERGVLPLVDFAYQGFGDGLDDDAAGLRAVADACNELLICSSFSKNFGLYNERVGADGGGQDRRRPRGGHDPRPPRHPRQLLEPARPRRGRRRHHPQRRRPPPAMARRTHRHAAAHQHHAPPLRRRAR